MGKRDLKDVEGQWVIKVNQAKRVIEDVKENQAKRVSAVKGGERLPRNGW